MAKPSKRRKAVEKRQNGVLTRHRQQERRKAKAAKVAARLMGQKASSIRHCEECIRPIILMRLCTACALKQKMRAR